MLYFDFIVFIELIWLIVSPRLLNCVVILVDAALVPCGTAFIVSRNCLLTAYHNIAHDSNNPTKAHKKDWKVVKGLERTAAGSITPLDGEIPVDVTVHKFSHTADWVILKRQSGQFDINSAIPICTKQEVPKYGEETNVKIYHCAVDLFKSGYMSALRPIPFPCKVGFNTNHKVFIQGGLFGGSSGAVCVVSDPYHRGFGKAFAMHVQSLNSAKSKQEVIDEGLLTDSDEVMAEVSDSCVNSHASFMEGILIPMYSTLMSNIF